MGIEHSKGTQKLCYINAQHEEECFRNTFENHNVFEMGFDIVQKDIEDPFHSTERHHEFVADPSLPKPPHKIDSEHHHSHDKPHK